MSFETALLFAKDFLILIVVFGSLLAYSFFMGKRSIILIIFSLYIALLISLQFPYYESIFNIAPENTTYLKIGVFIAFIYAAYRLLDRYISHSLEWGHWRIIETVLLSAAATILVMAFSYHVLPVTEVIDFSSRIDEIFATSDFFFWWLVIPLGALLFLG